MTEPEGPILTERELQAMRDLVAGLRAQLSPEHYVSLVDMIEVMTELRAVVSEADDDAPADETLLAQAIARVRARRSR